MKNLLVLGSLLLVSGFSMNCQAQTSPIAGTYIIQSDDNANEGCNFENNYYNAIIGSTTVITADDQQVALSVVVSALNSNLPSSALPYGTVAGLDSFDVGVVNRVDTIDKETFHWDGEYNADRSVFTYKSSMTPDRQNNASYTITYTRTATSLIITVVGDVAQENRTCVLKPTN
jgi:hypothetical protein